MTVVAAQQREEQLTDKDFAFICHFVYQRSGIVLNEGKKEMVYRRLTRVVRDRKLKSFAEYCQILKTNPEAEQDYFINAITTNLTSFFRENHHFEYLRDHEFPRLLNNNKDRRIRIWSSACSTGEEPYSIAITTLKAMSTRIRNWDVKILATDIDSNVLATAKAGIYKDKPDLVPEVYKRGYFQKGRDGNANKVRIQPQVQELITFKQLNLLHSWPMKGPFDVIFCRNVIIYFDKPTQEELFSRYYQLLKPGGLLILGHSESLGSYQQYFETIGRTIFRKPEHG